MASAISCAEVKKAPRSELRWRCCGRQAHRRSGRGSLSRRATVDSSISATHLRVAPRLSNKDDIWPPHAFHVSLDASTRPSDRSFVAVIRLIKHLLHKRCVLLL
jgi:hypothetical protein